MTEIDEETEYSVLDFINKHNIIYNTAQIVNYTNNEEYRISFRDIFKMKAQIHDMLDMDKETQDEFNYDTCKATMILDYVYLITHKNLWFKVLYNYSASIMLSNDPEIGLTILFSYDYFYLFHQCVCDFIQDPNSINELNQNYIKILETLTNKK